MAGGAFTADGLRRRNPTVVFDYKGPIALGMPVAWHPPPLTSAFVHHCCTPFGFHGPRHPDAKCRISRSMASSNNCRVWASSCSVWGQKYSILWRLLSKALILAVLPSHRRACCPSARRSDLCVPRKRLSRNCDQAELENQAWNSQNCFYSTATPYHPAILDQIRV